VLYDVLVPHAGRLVVDGIAASCLDPVDYLLGRLALVTGDRERARAHLVAAVAQTRALGAPLLAAHAELALAVVVDDAHEADGLRAHAAAVLGAAGADPVAAGVAATAAPAPAGRPSPPGRSGVFRCDGSSWTLTFDGHTVHVPDAKGLHDVHQLLSRPGRPVPAVALRGQPDPGATMGDPVLDEQARSAYRRRLRELDDAVEDAESTGDGLRAERARAEREFLLDELAAATGLGGRSRRLGDDTDRARKAVTMRIRNAISRIGSAHPSLARHLTAAVRTGRVCSYDPEQPVVWTL
jgi:hypothetical protein